ncbi:MAG: hypothetical protein CVU32_01110 [Betaproteobacteria bacterium HGW-Betaproteobacteria-5]|jgi:hypothetical protein|nr:MAG: hypothetical protein CVU32_01110 [Betaproteobacteria bacterium HGW-Betaproteobacteria-5]
MDRLNILVLHCLGNPALAPAFLNHHVFALRRNCPGHNYLYHDATLALPAYVAEQHFDAIVLDVSFLTARWVGSDFFEARKSTYAFVRDSSAVKIAFPQDEYDCNELLDEWMCDWRVDVVFSVISSGWDVLYPRYHKLGDIRLGYTGYIDETLLDRPIKPFARRPIDIGYRAKKLPPYFGRIGETKWTVGRDVALQAHRAGLKVDIELGDAGTLLGDAWLDFIGNSKFTLGANSGSSLLDPKGDIQRSVRSYLADYPEASFDEVEAACFPAMEGRYSFTAISPRVLEAALLNSAQILVDGEYSGIVKAGEHFIPIRPDASNFSEVLAAMSDVQAMERMTARCREAILSVEALRYSNKARMILDLVGDLASRKKSGADPEKIEKVISRYIEEMQPRYKAHWRRQYFREKVARAVAPYPVLYQALRSAARILR